MTFKEKNLVYKDIELDEDEVDIYKLFKIIFSRRKIVLFSSLISIIFGYFYFKFTKPIWEGQFDIVLKSNSTKQRNMNPLDGINSAVLSQFIGQPSTLDLKTEVQILKSQSILMPIFDFVKKEKLKKGIDWESVNFSDWQNKLDIQLIRQTSALNIKYYDDDKSSIKPVLTRISKAYQKYSSQDRDKGLKKGIDYLQKQLSKVKKESSDSLKLLQEFSIKNNMGGFDGLLPDVNNFDLEIKDNKSLRNMPLNLDSKISLPSKNYSDMETMRFNDNFAKLYKLESLLIEKSSYLKPNSTHIKELKKRIDSLKNSVRRSPEVLLEYRDLRREAFRNQKLLATIESQLTSLNLDLARIEDPWELISDPTLSTAPVFPSRNKSMFYAFLIGFGMSSIFSIIDYKNKDLVDDFLKFRKKIPYPHIKTFSKANFENWSDTYKIIQKNYFYSENKNGILLVKNREGDKYREFEKIFKNNKQENILASSSLIDLENCDNLLIIFENASITSKKLGYLLEDINLLKVNILGWILID